jgi:endogenous inhibitor of DNA gyrase (YacG/DUF329 family)
MAGNVVTLKATRPCPICGKPSTQQFHPFCSARCSDVDLNRWLSSVYVVPVKPEEEAAAEADKSVPGGPDTSDTDDEEY